MKRIVAAILIAAGIYAFQFSFLAHQSAFLPPDAFPSQQDRRMRLFSENAFYYEYYDRLVTAPAFGQGLKELTSDRQFTYPDPVNAVAQFNIWQEIAGAWTYRTAFSSTDPLTFYVYWNIAVHALIPPTVFLAIFFLSSNILCGLGGFMLYYSVMQFASRLYSYPALRENFGLPFVLLTCVLTVFYIRKPNNVKLVCVGLAALAQSIFWQFAMVLTAIKTGALFAYWLINPKDKVVIQRLLLADLAVYLVLLLVFAGNRFYVNPMYLAPVTVFLGLTFYPLESRPARTAFFAIVSGTLYFGVNKLLGLSGSSHLTEFFLDRFFGIKTFYSQLYLVVGAFNAISPEMIAYLTKNLLLPVLAVGLLIAVGRAKLHMAQKYEFLLWLLTGGYLLLGCVINRFIIIGLPLAVIVSMLMIASLWDAAKGLRPSIPYFPQAVCGLILLAIAVCFVLNLKNFTRRSVAMSDYASVAAYNQLKPYLKPTDVIASDMMMSASLALLTDNPLVIHPQFEYAENRRRSKMFNRAYGYTDTGYMHDFFRELGADYVILRYSRCFVSIQNKVNMREAIHLDFPKQTDDLFCSRDLADSPYFLVVEQNDSGRILKVLP